MALSWFQSYLTDRTQTFTCKGGCVTECQPAKTFRQKAAQETTPFDVDWQKVRALQVKKCGVDTHGERMERVPTTEVWDRASSRVQGQSP